MSFLTETEIFSPKLTIPDLPSETLWVGFKCASIFSVRETHPVQLADVLGQIGASLPMTSYRLPTYAEMYASVPTDNPSLPHEKTGPEGPAS